MQMFFGSTGKIFYSVRDGGYNNFSIDKLKSTASAT
jgi:hypothetical protein